MLGERVVVNGVGIYVHHGLEDMAGFVADVLATNRNRWDDPEYLAANIFRRLLWEGYSTAQSALLAGDGYGLSAVPYPSDDDMVIECHKGSRKVVYGGVDFSFDNFIGVLGGKVYA